MQKLRILFLCLAAALSCVSHSQALPAPVHITIHGHPYAIELQENSALIAKLGASGADQQGRHFRGRLTQQVDSWVRLSEVDGKWSGIVSLAGEKYVIEDAPGDADGAPDARNKQQAATRLLAATPVVELAREDTRCAVPTSAHGLQQKTHSVLSAPKAQAVAFDSLCATTIDGLCMLAEVEFVFDLAFQQLLGDSAQSTAAAIVNMAEGFYESDLSIGFDVLTMHFLSTDVFSSNTNASTLLNDLRDKKSTGQLSFVKNPQALLHLVTGRNFDGSTAGIALTKVLCDGPRRGVGTSQLLTGFGASQAALTALVVAHEIGHNFGANHDATGNACDAGFIMEARVNSSTSGFSSCSISEISDTISTIRDPARCFNFPVDVAISASAENVNEVVAGQAFTTAYLIQSNRTFQALPQLRIDGSVSTGLGKFVSATLNGAACVVARDGQTYTCTIASPGSVANLQVVALGGGAAVAYLHKASVSGTADLLETNADNNQLFANVSVTPGPPGGNDPAVKGGSASSPPPADNPPTATAPSNNGGGGSFADLALLFFLLALLNHAARNVLAGQPRANRCL